MVKPIIEYAAVVWAPHTKRDIDMIERTQRQAARFVTSNYSRYAIVSRKCLQTLIGLHLHDAEMN